MVEQLHRLQPIGMLTMTPRSPVPEPKGLVQAATAGGAARHEDRHPDLPGQGSRDRIAGATRHPPPPELIGPPPTFRLNVLEADALESHNPEPTPPRSKDQPKGERPPPAPSWPATATARPSTDGPVSRRLDQHL